MAVREWKAYRILAGLATKLWAASGATILACFVLYCFYGGLTAFLMLMVSLSAIFYHAQDNFLFHPELPQHSRICVPVPSMFGLPYESIHIRSSDSTSIHAYWIPQPGERSRYVPTIVYFHGNAGNMGHRLQNALGIFNSLQCNILMVEYRGYGLSTGNPAEKGFYNDARTAIDYVFSRHDVDTKRIILFGRSLGGAVVIDVASDPVYNQRILCCIVENTFTSIRDMSIELIHPSLKYLPAICYKNRFNSLSKVQFLLAPTLFISGMQDALVPPKMMTILFNRCGSINKEILQIPGGTHNDTWTSSGYYDGIAAFLNRCPTNNEVPLQVAPSFSQTNWPTIQEV